MDDAVLDHGIVHLRIPHGEEVRAVVEVEGHVEDVVAQVVDLPSGLPEDDRARRDVDDAHGAGVPLRFHVIAVGFPFRDDLHLQGGASQRTAGADLLRHAEGVRMGAVPLVDHQEQVVHDRLPHMDGAAVLERALALLGADDVAGGQVPQISETDVREAGLPDRQ